MTILRQALVAGVLLLLFIASGFDASGATQTTAPPGIDATTESLIAPSAVPSATAPIKTLTRPITTEMTIRAVLILLLFVAVAVCIATRKIPAMVALPLMAFGIAVVAGVPFSGPGGILETILEGRTTPSPAGAFQLYKAIIYVLFGGMFARFISDSGIAERIVKYAAEYGGEDPFFISLLMSAICILIFTATGGLPMIIMLGTVMFPILLSLGVTPVVAGCLLLMAFPVGSCLSPAGWSTVAELYQVPLAKTRQFFMIWAGVQVVALVLFLSVEFLRMKRTTVTTSSILRSVGTILMICLALGSVVFLEAFAELLPFMRGGVESAVHYRNLAGVGLQWAISAGLVLAILHSQFAYHVLKTNPPQWSLVTPILPLVFLLGLGFNNAIIPAFLASLTYGFLTTPQERGMQKLGRSVINGVSDVAAPVVLMTGIGMLIAAATHPRVDSILTPLLARVVPTDAVGYVIFFLLASPLALYRGPLNEFGLGIGVAKLMQNFMPPAATMGALRSVGMLQDPTTTQNVWICGYLKLDINALMFKLFGYSIGLVIIGLCMSAYMFFPGK